jgi:hypothetical protein
MAIPISYIVGTGLKGTISNFSIYMDIQWTSDFDETKVQLADGNKGAFKRSSFEYIFGMKYYIPFRR